jgi:hypothetical protein
LEQCPGQSPKAVKRFASRRGKRAFPCGNDANNKVFLRFRSRLDLIGLSTPLFLIVFAAIAIGYIIHCTVGDSPDSSRRKSWGLALRSSRNVGAWFVLRRPLMDQHSAIMAPTCPCCEQPMSVSSAPKSKFFPLPKSLTFECNRCAVIATTNEVLFADNEHPALGWAS